MRITKMVQTMLHSPPSPDFAHLFIQAYERENTAVNKMSTVFFRQKSGILQPTSAVEGVSAFSASAMNHLYWRGPGMRSEPYGFIQGRIPILISAPHGA